MSQSDADAFYTPAELAKMLKVTEDTLSAWRRRGAGPPYLQVAPGLAVRYPAVAFKAWAAANTVAAPGPPGP